MNFESTVARFKALFQQFSGGTEEHYEDRSMVSVRARTP
jgi:hypothetical protein